MNIFVICIYNEGRRIKRTRYLQCNTRESNGNMHYFGTKGVSLDSLSTNRIYQGYKETDLMILVNQPKTEIKIQLRL